MSALPTQQATGSVPPRFAALTPLASPLADIDVFLATEGDAVCLVATTTSSVERWCGRPRHIAEQGLVARLPVVGSEPLDVVVIPDRFGQFGDHLLVLDPDAAPGVHTLSDAAGAVLKFRLAERPPTAGSPTADIGNG